MIQHQIIVCQSQDVTMQAAMYYETSKTDNKHFSLHFVCDEWGHLVAMEYNIFDALCRLRAVLESNGCLICCNGARRDTWASGIAKDMGGGERVYATRLGRPATPSDLVPILAPADCSICVALSAQLAYHIQWLQSILEDDAMSNHEAAIPDQLTYEANFHAKGYVYKIEDSGNLGGHVLPEAIMGAWKVDEGGRVVEPFIPNPSFKPLRYGGPTSAGGNY